MRKSKRETEATRKRIVEMAAEEFRQHGIVASGIADLMAAVGLTHGGFYRHFDSKEQLVAEATAAALDTILDTLAGAASGKKGRNGLKAASAVYLCAEHRDNPRDGCPLAALGSELARSDGGSSLGSIAFQVLMPDLETSTLKAQVRRPLVLGIDAGATTDALVAGVDSDRIVCSCVPRDGSNNRHDRT